MADKELSGDAVIGRNRAREMVYPVDVSDVQKTVRDAVKKKNSISIYASTLGMSLTHYAAGMAPIYFGAGYIEQGTWWRIGFMVSVVNVIIWLGLGLVWWKALGWW